MPDPRAVAPPVSSAPADADGVPTVAGGSAAKRDTPTHRLRSGSNPVVPTPPDADPAVLPRIGGYQLLEEVGRGGMGVVYKARQLNLNRLVALKVVRAGGPDGHKDAARFQDEAEAVGRLQHANIVQIFDVGDQNGCPYYAMEYVEGGSLSQRLAGRPQPPAESGRMAETLARAVHHAHQRGLVHRDLKPSNVLVAGDGMLKITDFGVAKHLDRAEQTRTGCIVGTPSYMAPEQAAGRSKEVGPASDVYALGAMLYEMMTGRRPFDGDDTAAVFQRVQFQEPARPSRLRPGTPRDLETICLKCLEKEPARRYASAEALAEDLGRFLRGEPIRARPVGMGGRAARWARRRPVLTALVGWAVLATAAGGIAAWKWAEAADNVRDTIDAVARKNEAEERAGKEEKARRHTEQTARAEGLAQEAGVLFEQGEAGRALLTLARALQAAPADETALRHAIAANIAAWSGQIPHIRSTITFGRSAKDAPPYPHPVLSPDGKRLVASAENAARLLDADTGEAVGDPLPHSWKLAASPVFTPDGKYLRTVDETGTVRWWRAADGRPAGECLLDGKPGAWVHFSPDGTHALSLATRTTARLWEIVPPGGPEGAVARPVGEPLALSTFNLVSYVFSPDGSLLATACRDAHSAGFLGLGAPEFELRLWRTDTGKAVGEPFRHPGYKGAMQFSRDGTVLLTMSAERGEDGHGSKPAPSDCIRLWRTNTGEQIGDSLTLPFVCRETRFSPDGKSVFACGWKRIERWPVEAEAGKARPSWGAIDAAGATGFSGVGISPDGAVLCTLADEARLWKVEADALRPVASLPHPERAAAAAFSPDGRAVATTCVDRMVRLWDASTGAALAPPLAQPEEAVGVEFAADGRTVLTWNDWTARFWDAGGALRQGQTLTPAGVSALSFSDDGKTVATLGALTDKTAGGQTGREIQLWDLAHATPLARPLRLPGTVESLALRADGKRLWTARRVDRRFTETPQVAVQLWDVPADATGACTAAGAPTTYDGGGATFGPAGDLLVTTTTDEARVWRTGDGRLLGRTAFGGAMSLTLPSPDGRTVLLAPLVGLGSGTVGEGGGSLDEIVAADPVVPPKPQLWQPATGRRFALPEDLSEQDLTAGFSTSSTAFGTDGQTLLTRLLDGTVQVWSADGRRLGKPFGRPRQHYQGPAALFPDGRRVVLATGTDRPQPGGTVQVWSVEDEENHPLWSLSLPTETTALVVTGDGRTVLTAGRDQTLRRWDADTGAAVGPAVRLDAPVQALRPAPDGRSFLTVSGGKVRLWRQPSLPADADAERIRCWLEVVTNREIKADGLCEVLTPQAWRDRRDRLRELGGAPAP